MFDIQDIDLKLKDGNNDNSSTNCQRVFFDIEGGLSFKSDIIQIACITTDWDFNVTNVQASYFRNTTPITEGEFNAHGLTEEFLWENATNYFGTEITKFPFYPDIPTMFISYTSFDIRKISEQVIKANLPPVDFGVFVSALTLKPKTNNYYDGFILGGTKLTKTVTAERQIMINELVNEVKHFYSEVKLQAHDALYDTIMLLALCKGMIK